MCHSNGYYPDPICDQFCFVFYDFSLPSVLDFTIPFHGTILPSCGRSIISHVLLCSRLFNSSLMAFSYLLSSEDRKTSASICLFTSESLFPANAVLWELVLSLCGYLRTPSKLLFVIWVVSRLTTSTSFKTSLGSLPVFTPLCQHLLCTYTVRHSRIQVTLFRRNITSYFTFWLEIRVHQI